MADLMMLYDIIKKDAITDEETLNVLDEISYLKSEDITNFIEIKCAELQLCPICFKELDFKTDKEYKGEYWGAPCYQITTRKQCSYCGYEE